MVLMRIQLLSAIKNLIAAKKYDEALVKGKFASEGNNPDEIFIMDYLLRFTGKKVTMKKPWKCIISLIERNPDNPQIQLSYAIFSLRKRVMMDLFVLLNTVFINNKVSREDKISLVAKNYWKMLNL